MALPIIKLIFVAYRIISRPLNNIIVKAIKARGQESNFRYFFIWFGQKFHIYEVKVNRYIVKEETKSANNQNEDDDIKVYIKPLADEPAFNKGVEYFSEIFFFYNILMLLALYELKKASDSASA